MSFRMCGSSLLVDLPDDILAMVGRSLSPRDICNLSLCCKSLNALVASDKIWLTQCELVGVVSSKDLVEWRKAVLSYKALCRFLASVKPLLGIWVHKNPELGNVVYVMPGFVSVVGCRIIPQKRYPLGIEEGPILWAPVFEVIGDYNGSTIFTLHGRDNDRDYIYPGSVKSVEKTCNVLLLEVEPEKEKKWGKAYSKSFCYLSDEENERKISRIYSRRSRSQGFVEQNMLTVPFNKLSSDDQMKLLEIVTSQVRMEIPGSDCSPLFPCLRGDEGNFQRDTMLLSKRRSLLIEMHKLGRGCIDWLASHKLLCPPTEINLSEIKKILDRSSSFPNSLSGDDTRSQCVKRRTLRNYVRDRIRQLLRRSSSGNGSRGTMSSSLSSENRHAQLHDFLSAGDTIGLTLHASTMELSSYHGWPYMGDSLYALYKLPIGAPTLGQEYAGLWGGTFGWPPGKSTGDKAIFFLVLSYEESPGQKLLIATQILVGIGYVLYPNGSAMFIVNVDKPAVDPFPWNVGGNSLPVSVKQAFSGEGIANGYGFRCPGSKPGSLFVLNDGMLVFLWKETRAVLRLQRLNLEYLLKKGKRVPALPPIPNFSYLERSNENVFAGLQI